ncbi:MAG: amidohydrolase [Geodermatophilaceae bacterium]|nr:amidohydrolase [Geodermatophilaceae bacterium]
MRVSLSWLDRWVEDHTDDQIALRRQLHAYPELSFGENQTTELLASTLRSAGLNPQILPTGTGLICDVGEGERVVGFRADIDALPLRDLKSVPYRSTVDGVCHACGHDAHATIAIGVALALASAPALPGRVRLIFQPAEETIPGGAQAVLSSGGLDGLERVFAFHCDPRLDCGQVGLLAGPITAAADSVEVTLRGPGGHTARPHLTVDLVDALARVVTSLPGLLSRQVDPRAGLSLVWAAIGAGIAHNTIPETGRLRGTVRVLRREAWDDAEKRVCSLIEQVVAPTGAEVTIDYTRGVPPVVNDAGCVELLRSGVMDALGADGVAETVQSMGAEDFGWYADVAPIALARLGTASGGRELDLHQGSFDIDEQALAIGVRVMTRTLLTSLTRPGS